MWGPGGAGRIGRDAGEAVTSAGPSIEGKGTMERVDDQPTGVVQGGWGCSCGAHGQGADNTHNHWVNRVDPGMVGTLLPVLERIADALERANVLTQVLIPEGTRESWLQTPVCVICGTSHGLEITCGGSPSY